MNSVLRHLLGLPDEATALARQVDHLHALIIGSTMAGATAVGLLAVGFAIVYRRRLPTAAVPGAAVQPTPGPPPRPPGRTALAVEGALVALLFALFVGWWVIGYRQYLELLTPPPDGMPILVSAKQWMWKFAYPDGRRSLSLLVVPAGRPVTLLMTSRDVIHGFYVPDFRLKHDVVPGMVATAWFAAERPGLHQILCSQYCGTSHARMRGTVVVLSPADFARWSHGEEPALVLRAEREDRNERAAIAAAQSLAGRADEASADQAADAEPELTVDLAARGRQVASLHGCFACHTDDGQRHIGPTWRGLYLSQVPLSDGRTVLADATYLTRSMMDPNADIVAGYQPVMPSYQGLLDPADAAAIIAFIASLRSGPVAGARQDGAVGEPIIPPLPPATIAPGTSHAH